MTWNKHASRVTGYDRGTNRPEVVTKSAQTRAQRGGIVSREGGGTVRPTLGGGCGLVAPSGATFWGCDR